MTVQKFQTAVIFVSVMNFLTASTNFRGLYFRRGGLIFHIFRQISNKRITVLLHWLSSTSKSDINSLKYGVAPMFQNRDMPWSFLGVNMKKSIQFVKTIYNLCFILLYSFNIRFLESRATILSENYPRKWGLFWQIVCLFHTYNWKGPCFAVLNNTTKYILRYCRAGCSKIYNLKHNLNVGSIKENVAGRFRL